MDAIHNIPTYLREEGGWHCIENIMADLECYDVKWGDRLSTGNESTFALKRVYEDGLERLADLQNRDCQGDS
jgi:hypothetical protein